MQHVRVVPYLAADGERLERVGHPAPLSEQLHEGAVESALRWGQAQHQDVLALGGEAATENLVAAPAWGGGKKCAKFEVMKCCTT